MHSGEINNEIIDEEQFQASRVCCYSEGMPCESLEEPLSRSIEVETPAARADNRTCSARGVMDSIIAVA